MRALESLAQTVKDVKVEVVKVVSILLCKFFYRVILPIFI